MASTESSSFIAGILADLNHREAKKREAGARRVAQAPTANRQVIERLKELAQSDERDYVRAAARSALIETAIGYDRAAAELRDFVRALQAAPAAAMPKPAAASVTPADSLQADAKNIAQAPASESVAAANALAAEPTAFVAASSAADSVLREPAAPPVPFDQWLLSERNIKLALYSGGALLVLAALIFVGVNWNHLNGVAKLSITLGLTVALYAVGIFLFNRPTLKIGGVALLAIASGFLPLNFFVAQTYLPLYALDGIQMWLAASVICGAVYGFTAWGTRHVLFTWFALVAMYSGLAALGILIAPRFTDPNRIGQWYALLVTLATFGLLVAADRVRNTELARFTYRPLLIVPHILIPLISASAMLLLYLLFTTPEFAPDRIVTFFDCAHIAVGIAFYIYFDLRWHKPWSRSIAALLYAVTAVLLVGPLGMDELQGGLFLMLVALSLLGIGWWLWRRGGKLEFALPIFLLGYAVAALVTYRASMHWFDAPIFVALALAGDVALLAVSWLIFRRYQWVYATLWGLLLTIGVSAHVLLSTDVAVGLVLAGVMVIYTVVGLYVRQRAPHFGWAFLSGAVMLSVVVPVMTGSDLVVTAGMLTLGGVLYLVAALVLKKEWLLVPALVGWNLAAVTLTLAYVPRLDQPNALLIVFGALGLALLFAAIALRTTRAPGWRLPVYIIAGVDLALAFVLGLQVGMVTAQTLFAQILGLVVTLVCAAACFAVMWVERDFLREYTPLPVLSYVGAGLTLLGAYEVVRLLPIQVEYQVVGVAIAAGLMVGAGYVLRGETARGMFGVPFRLVGYGGLALAALLSLPRPSLLPIAATFAIAGFVLLAEGIARRAVYLVYAAGGAFIVTLWALLQWNSRAELQLYALPLGLVLLAIGWNERRSDRWQTFTLAAAAGLVVLLGTALYQSFNNVYYALLLFVESVIAVGLGVFLRSRIFVTAGILALIVNGIVQFGPAFLNIDRWIQVGAIGTLLLVIGMLALFRRERLLLARQSVTATWQSWKP